MDTPYEYYNGKLGVKVSFLLSDKRPHQDSIGVVRYRTLHHGIHSSNNRLHQLRKPATNQAALIEFSTLCTEWQDQLVQKFGAAPKKVYENYLALHFEYDVTAFNYFSMEYTEGDEKRRLTPELIEEYTSNASVLNAVRIVKDKRTSFRSLLNASCRDIWKTLSVEVNAFNEVNHTLPVTADGLRKKYRAYEKEGYSVLVNGRRNNQNAKKVSEKLVQLLNNLFAGQDYKPTVADVSRIYSEFLAGSIEVYNVKSGEQYMPEDFKPVTDRTIRAYLGQWENKIGNHLIRSGNRQQYMGKYKPYHVLENPVYAGSLLSIDDRQPPFYYQKGKRAWFYIGVDLASGCITSYVYGKSKEGIILEFYRQLVRNYADWGINLPDGLECESSLNSSYRNTFLKPGAMFQDVRVEANNARGKKIERIFGVFRNQRERSSEGWIGRPFAKPEANQTDREKITIIPFDRLIKERLKDIEDWNNEEHHSEKGKTRWEYFTERQHPNLKPTNWLSFMPYIGYRTDTSCRVGYVQLQEEPRMIAENGQILLGDELIAKMKLIEGQNIQVYWLDANDGSVLKAFAFMGSEYICELMAIPTYNRAAIERTEQDEANREIQKQYRSTVDAFGRAQKKSVKKVVILSQSSKTLNRKFVIPGLNPVTPSTSPAVAAPDYDTDEDNFPMPTKQPAMPSWRNAFQ